MKGLCHPVYTATNQRSLLIYTRPPIRGVTLPETNMAPENQWLEDEFPFWGPAYFQGLCFKFQLTMWCFNVSFLGHP